MKESLKNGHPSHGAQDGDVVGVEDDGTAPGGDADGEVFEVQCILTHRDRSTRPGQRVREFLVHWQGCGLLLA
jgi:hypothetical protein